MLEGKKVLLGITGSIAAYKSALLCRLLIKAGAQVRVVMTESAMTFITPLTLSTLSGNQVVSAFSENGIWNNHVELAGWADFILIAPCSATTLSRMASGYSDNLLTTIYLSADCPVIVAPAMDREMWLHATTKRNLSLLESDGVHVIPVESGFLASGLEGDGRMAEPENILEYLDNFISKEQDLIGKRILITAGPTYESVDTVRFIGNRSTGKMGYALAEECVKRGAAVTIISGPVGGLKAPATAKLMSCETAEEMYQLVDRFFADNDIVILTAAVADYAPANPVDHKIKKGEDALQIHLKPTVDIAAAMGKKKRQNQILVGFALESDEGSQEASRKLHNKNLDCIVLNSLQHAGAGFGHDTNQISIFDKQGSRLDYPLATKQRVASDIMNYIVQHLI
jgi:phosphopantothenoylcysteine decarboxylase/phosphopantothenate--cysteine ligase